MTEKNTPTGTSEPKPSADDSGSFPSLSESEELLTPVIPLLRKSVAHMKESNEFVKMTNKELIKLNRNVIRQNRLLWLLVIGSLLLLGGLFFSLDKLHTLGIRLDAQLVQQTMTNTKLAAIVAKLISVDEKADAAKEALDDQTQITVKPADTTDPSSKPVLVVRPPKSRPVKAGSKKPPAAVESVEIPLDLPDKK